MRWPPARRAKERSGAQASPCSVGDEAAPARRRSGRCQRPSTAQAAPKELLAGDPSLGRRATAPSLLSTAARSRKDCRGRLSHRKAFTGAPDRGTLQAAEGGTLFLDEVAMPAPLQVKLLRAIEEQAIRRLRANATIPVDVRILSATHRKIGRIAPANFARTYHRLNVRLISLRSRNGARRSPACRVSLSRLGEGTARPALSPEAKYSSPRPGRVMCVNSIRSSRSPRSGGWDPAALVRGRWIAQPPARRSMRGALSSANTSRES